MNTGNYTFTLIETGRFALDGGAMFGVVPKKKSCANLVTLLFL